MVDEVIQVAAAWACFCCEVRDAACPANPKLPDELDQSRVNGMIPSGLQFRSKLETGWPAMPASAGQSRLRSFSG